MNDNADILAALARIEKALTSKTRITLRRRVDGASHQADAAACASPVTIRIDTIVRYENTTWYEKVGDGIGNVVHGMVTLKGKDNFIHVVETHDEITRLIEDA